MIIVVGLVIFNDFNLTGNVINENSIIENGTNWVKWFVWGVIITVVLAIIMFMIWFLILRKDDEPVVSIAPVVPGMNSPNAASKGVVS